MLLHVVALCDSMATVLRVDEHFTAEHIGKALAKLYNVDVMMMRLEKDGNHLYAL